MLNDETTFLALHADGQLRVGDRDLGRVSSDGTFLFSDGGGLVSARLTEDGRVVLLVRKGTDLAKIPGALGRVLRAHGGELASAYTIHDDGTAHAVRARPLSFDGDGRLSERGLVVRGLTAATRRTALFVYLIATTISL